MDVRNRSIIVLLPGGSCGERSGMRGWGLLGRGDGICREWGHRRPLEGLVPSADLGEGTGGEPQPQRPRVGGESSASEELSGDVLDESR